MGMSKNILINSLICLLIAIKVGIIIRIESPYKMNEIIKKI